MDVLRTVDAMQNFSDAAMRAGKRVALVPTMGALHDGHLALVRRATEEADVVVVSIFVNPTQFAPGEDYDEYPRELDADREKLEPLDVDAVFAPPVSEMYPDAGSERMPGSLTWVDVERLDAHLCGAYRDNHFRGVTTVVAKLLHACKPDVAVFGRKDAQQFVILRRMVKDLLMDVEMIGVPTVREPSGLAQSSRNEYLSDAEREQAAVLYEAVTTAKARVKAGEQDPQALVRAMQNALQQAPDAQVQYAEVVDADTLQPVEHLESGQEILAAVAVFFGDTRLIDNAFMYVPEA